MSQAEQGGPGNPVPAPAAAPASPPGGPLVEPQRQDDDDDSQAEVILPRLEGIVLVTDPATVQQNGVAVHGISTPDIALLRDPDFQDTMISFLGRPVTKTRLSEISGAIVAFYRKQGHPFVNVTIPPQNIQSGTVQFLVVEYRISRVAVEGNRWFSDATILRQVRLRPGEVVDEPELTDDLDRLNENTFLHVSAVYRPGETPGTTQVLLRTDDRFPLGFDTSYDNSGTETTGLGRWGAGFTWGNALGLADVLSFHYQSSTDLLHGHESVDGKTLPPSFQGYSASYLAPLPYGQSLNLFGSYQKQVPVLGESLGEVGVNGQVSLRYDMNLRPLYGMKQHVGLGYDFKTSNNNLAFGGTQVFASTTQIDQFLLDYGLDETDKWGRTSLQNEFVFSPGNLTGLNNNETFQENMPGATARYAYDHLTLTRVTTLPLGLSAVTTGTFQATNQDLLASEQLCAGGIDTVPGYLQCTISGSEGLLLSQSLRSPSFSLASLLRLGERNDQMQFDAFWDYAAVRNRTPSASMPGPARVESIGLGVRYAIDRYMTFRLEYGWQLIAPPGHGALGSFGNFSLNLSF